MHKIKSNSTWRFSILFLVMLVITVMTSCEDNPVKPIADPPETITNVRLVPLSNNDIAKVTTDDRGNKWLPKIGAADYRILAKSAAADITFEEMNATRYQMYVVLVEGDKPVFDLEFEANDLLVIPHSIATITVAAQGTSVSAYPIITIIKEHVKPYSNAGSLLEMTVGEWTDTLNLTYNYQLGQDTVTVLDPYSVDGTNMGSIIDVLLSDIPIQDYTTINNYNWSQPDWTWEHWTITGRWGFTAADLDVCKIINSGNVSLQIRLVDFFSSTIYVDTMLSANDTLNVSGLLRDDENPATGQTILVGNDLNQPYIFEMAGLLYTNGYSGIVIGEKPED